MVVKGQTQPVHVKEKPVPPPPRVVIEGVQPEINHGKFPIKRTVGEDVVVTADIFAEGHDLVAAVLRHGPIGGADWTEVPLSDLGNDRWSGTFTVTTQGRYGYTLQAWVDAFATWRRDLSKKVDAGLNVSSELLEGAELVKQAAQRAGGVDAERLRFQADVLGHGGDSGARVKLALDPELTSLMTRYVDRSGATTYERTLAVTVERERARYGAWYEMFPRSSSPDPGRHGTFKDVEARLPYVVGMGFDVLYLPPIHPIGLSFRKGPNNTLTPGPNDPGSPWAIGSPEGGHKAVLPELGTLEDFDHLVARARELGLELALDIAYQCSPDHPYVKEHPEWFRHRPDGSIKYAENPPKKYQDIYPIDFESSDWQTLWEELRDVVLFWVSHGVTIFRVDNPHTKAFPFWEWMIREVWDRHPDTIFLAEAFTRPKVMKYLAKSGFSQSYSYFTWRTTREGLTEYFTELTQTEVAEYMRPNLFANTPDILHESLQHGGRPAFQARLVLAATLGATYGIYGPPFEHCDGTPVRPGSEEYLDSEKYQCRYWNLDEPGTLRYFVSRVNTIRRDNPALHFDRNLRFFSTSNSELIAYAKTTPDHSDIILVVVNLDPFHVQEGSIQFPFWEFGLNDSYQVHDLLSDARYDWRGDWNFVRLDPHVCPAHIFRVWR
ncbi:alpha-1,4-glucan--maltose-1-phosphate maltosyltransferase [Singulisphaera sp. GP187]|uniref:alpha-1,4-glucan--maltose-1-phosphate maltosyltransferase n=1 Tax=Singulisphaera sp. GP187 TaxID=1882752 RepID=UPI003965798C